jgi:tetratricopeptide (TPR) repeat protein
MMKQEQLDDRLDESAALIAAGDFAHARTLLLEITSVFPDSAKAWKGLGVAAEKLGDHLVAERHLTHSLRLDGTDGDAWSVLGGLYFYDMDRPAEALECFRQGLAIDPADTYPLMNCLTVEAVGGEGESLVQEYASVLKESEIRCTEQIEAGVNLPWCHFDLALALFFQGRLDECRAALRAAFDHASDWQISSASLPYERLSGIAEFAGPARAVREAFATARPVEKTA